MPNDIICYCCYCNNDNVKISIKYFFKACKISKCRESRSHEHLLCKHCLEFEKDEVCIYQNLFFMLVIHINICIIKALANITLNTNKKRISKRK